MTQIKEFTIFLGYVVLITFLFSVIVSILQTMFDQIITRSNKNKARKSFEDVLGMMLEEAIKQEPEDLNIKEKDKEDK